MKVLIYAAGVLTGMLLMAANRYSVRRAVEAERTRTDNERERVRMLQAEINRLNNNNDCANAARIAREDERGKRQQKYAQPVRNATQIQADNLIHGLTGGTRKVDIRGPKPA